MKKLVTAFIFIVILSGVFISDSFSQWSSDSSVNLEICGTLGEQVVSKVAGTSDGGCYISWFDNRGGGYKVYLQRLNSSGVKQFADDGLLISSHPQSSSLVNWDLIADDSNNAVIVFTDTRNGTDINPFAYRISPQGSFLWGADGVTLSNDFTVYQANPKVEQTSDNSFVITWIYSSTPNKVAMQKLNSAGIPQWGADPIYLEGEPTENFTYPDLVDSDNGSVILMWSGYSGSFLNPVNYKLYSQKFSPQGTALWTAPHLTVYGLGRVSGFFVPKLFSDGNSGALYVWQDDRNSVNLSSSYIQHFNSNGDMIFPLNGTEVSTTPGVNKFDAWACYMPATNETFLIWKSANSNQNLFGIRGQKLSSDGTRQWSDDGIDYVPFNQNSSVNQICYTMDTNVVMSYNESVFGSANNQIKSFSVSRSGEKGWGGYIHTISSLSTSKSLINGLVNNAGMSILVWSEGRTVDSHVYAQNINSDGSLGNTIGIIPVSTETAEKYMLLQNYPNPFNPVTKINYVIPISGFVKLLVYDISGKITATLVNERQNAGSYYVEFKGNDLPSGVYFYKLETGAGSGKFVSVRKMMLLK